jgi:PKD repeat protein
MKSRALFRPVPLLVWIPAVCLAWFFQPLVSAQEPPVSLTTLPVEKTAESDNLTGSLFADQSPANAAVPLGNFEAAAASSKVLEMDLRNRAPLTLGKRTYKHGLLCLHGSTTWSYALNGKYTSLSAEGGHFSDGEASIRLYGDGKLLHDTGILLNNEATPFTVDLRGVKELKLVVMDVGLKRHPYNTTVVIGNPWLIADPLPDAAPTSGKNPANKPPVAKIQAEPSTGKAPLEVQFRGDKSTDSDGQVNRYTWHFGDGAMETLAPNPTHTFAEPGLYEVVLQAEDAHGGIGVTRQLVTVLPTLNQAPQAAISVSSHIVAPSKPVTCDASASTDADGSIATFEWAFGDGQSAVGPKVEHSFANPGRYPVTLTLTDNNAAKTTLTTSIRVATAEDLANPFPLKKGSRVLMLGNSLVSFSGQIKDWLKVFDQISPAPLGLTSAGVGKGMGKLEEYATWDRLGIEAKINHGWDIVIIQPWIEVLDPKVSDAELLKHATTLVNWVRASGAYPVFYEPQFGWTEGFKADQARAHDRIRQLAESLDTGFIPAGSAWFAVEKDYPLPVWADSGRGKTSDDPLAFNNLMFCDTGHQSYTGSLFNSLMVWKYLTGVSPKDIAVTDKVDLDPEHLKRIRWDLLPYFQAKADEGIVPAKEKLR